MGNTDEARPAQWPGVVDLRREALLQFPVHCHREMATYHTPVSIPQMVRDGKFMHIAAPMVRYSKLPFRLLCQKYGCDVTYTPMITSEEFVTSQEARLNEFSTNTADQPLVVQFAAKSAETLAKASTYLVGHCAGIDINCGCPQRWAIKEGYGGALLKQPELVREMVRQTKEASGLPCSIKIRIDPEDLNRTVELAKRAEAVGAEWVTVHGRTIHQASSEAVNYEAVKLVKENLTVPVFGNGSVFQLSDASDWKEKTGVDGVMSARGLLANPALFAGYSETPLECVRDFVDITMQVGGITTKIFHQHIAMMMYKSLTKVERGEFQVLKSMASIMAWLETRGLMPQDSDSSVASEDQASSSTSS